MKLMLDKFKYINDYSYSPWASTDKTSSRIHHNLTCYEDIISI